MYADTLKYPRESRRIAHDTSENHSMSVIFQPGRCPAPLKRTVRRQVAVALAEDAVGDDSSGGAVSADTKASAQVISREAGVLAGVFWFDEVFAQIDAGVTVDWHLRDGDALDKDACLCTLNGNARSLLCGERCALNFLQTLSGTATITAQFVARAAGRLTIKDTRKTLPGLRLAQKYAVVCGGGVNHRLDLSDAVLLKDNHIRACGSVGKAVAAARRTAAGRDIEVEVSSPEQVAEALAAGADTIMLDNFGIDEAAAAVRTIDGKAKSEISGGVGLDDIARLAETGADCVSVGAVTKHLRALDLSMRFI